MLPRILNHLLCSLLCFTAPCGMYHSKESTQGGTLDSSTQVWPARHNHGVVDYKALIGLSQLWVPHSRARCGASLKVIQPDTTSTSITKCFLVSWWNTRKHTNTSKSLELRTTRVIYRVRQITHRAITKNKWNQVIVTLHASKLKMNTRTKHIRTWTQNTRAHQSMRLLPELEWMLDSTLDSQQGFTCATNLNQNLYKWRTTSRVFLFDLHR
jgi:hypothetical protein